MSTLIAGAVRRATNRVADPRFRACLDRLISEADAALGSALAAPIEPAGYYHDYFCPDHGVQLAFDPSSPTEHRCPVDGAGFDGEAIGTP